jgi:hypothetical protein
LSCLKSGVDCTVGARSDRATRRLLGLKTGQPFAGRAFTHGESRRRLRTSFLVDDGLDKSFSTPWGQTSIGMNIMPWDLVWLV